MSEDEQATETTWLDSYPEEQRNYIEKKGFKDPTAILKSYTELERYHGGAKNLVEIPNWDAEPDDLNSFYDKLGRPQDPNEYGFKDAEDSAFPEDFREFLAKAAHESGLNLKQSKDLFERLNAQQSQMLENQLAEADQRNEQALAELKKQWGSEYDDNIKAGRKAAIALGMDEQSLDELDGLMGSAKLAELFALIGNKMGEGNFIEDGESKGYGQSAASARDQIDDLLADPAFKQAYMSGDRSARRRISELMEKAHPDDKRRH